ncbi:toprim domain-containing protein [Marinobacter sp. ATCH36]|uniref:toprim domain-containing protein n=1 Tax=Marinobacter sp. ATCH36 TaxID=2945106 RepID=UPI002021D911|nr:toprim domain-containing protein [Marinobacter sp. ATCH36]MCL7944063.1 toprim domain-containing protein [Marinobacter sp. ATCH36]
MFRDALQEKFGLVDWIPVPDGKIQRFEVPGDKPGSKNGWYVLFLDGVPAGTFGTWKENASYNWCARKPVDPFEAQMVANRIEQARRIRESERAGAQRDAAVRANRIWHQSKPASGNHPYLIRKDVEPHLLRQAGPALLVPLYAESDLVSLQFIYPDGAKRFLSDGRVKGCYSPIGTPEPGQPLYIVEGWATGATIRMYEGLPVACAMNAGNLLAVGRQLQARYLNSPLIIAGDDDRKSESEGEGNAGVKFATEAAHTLGCGMVLPEFPPEAPLALSDFNDLANWRASQ